MEKLDKNICLTRDQCIETLADKEIFIFGTGVDAEEAVNAIGSVVRVVAFIDNNRFGADNFFQGKKIISLQQFMKIKESQQIVLVATYRYGKEIIKQLENTGLVSSRDYYLWDDMKLFCTDQNTEKYIVFLKELWKKYDKQSRKDKILIPFDNRHDLMSVEYAYCSNYFAEKYNASIYCYFRGGAKAANASDVIRKIYNAFNVKGIIDSKLTVEQKAEAEELCGDIWRNLSDWEDWKNIHIYGIHFGTTIIRNFLRVSIPDFDIKSEKMHSFLLNAINTIVFWYHYFEQNNVKIVLLADGVSWDGYIRDIAVSKSIPVYALCYKMVKATLDFCDRPVYPYFKEMWGQLTQEEQTYGIKWAKEHISKRLRGGTDEVFYNNKKNYTFAEQKKREKILRTSNHIKIVICPHIFEEDCYWCGEQIFDDNYFEWLCHLGELSEQTPSYDWYLKMHPFAQRRDMIIIDKILQRYPKIKKIPSNISPIQLREEGIEYALTVYGTIGHEYPEIGIQVINAGVNPHSAFDFTWNPKTKAEYDELIYNLDKLNKKKDEEGLYQFYCLNYLYYNWEYINFRKLFFENPLLPMDSLELQVNGKHLGTWKYDEYMKEWTKERDVYIWNQLEAVFKKLDEWEPNKLYRKK